MQMLTEWVDKVRYAIANLETRSDRVLEPGQALAIIDDVVEAELAADEIAMIHGVRQEWIETTLGHVTRTVQGTGRVRSLDAGGWYAFHGREHPYEVAPGFTAAWKKARCLP
jgi:hypothetical protein